MSAATRLAAYATVVGLAFGGAALAGAAIDPTDDAVVAGGGHGAGEPMATSGDGEHGGAEARARSTEAQAGHGADSRGAGAEVAGLAVSEGGYSLDIDRAFFAADETAPLTFRITDGRGRVVRDEYELEHDKQLHLIVVRRDTAIFEHVHPRKRGDGTWTVDLTLREAGVYRAYADFKIGGRRLTLAADLFVPGPFHPNPMPAPATTDVAVDAAGKPADGLDVTFKAPGLRAGRESPLTFSVTRDGQPFERLEDHLGAKGHLVALRGGDLAYLHVHPTTRGAGHGAQQGGPAGAPRGNEIRFAARFPTAGRYRLFLQFKTSGEIRTVAYTVEVPR